MSSSHDGGGLYFPGKCRRDEGRVTATFVGIVAVLGFVLGMVFAVHPWYPWQRGAGWAMIVTGACTLVSAIIIAVPFNDGFEILRHALVLSEEESRSRYDKLGHLVRLIERFPPSQALVDDSLLEAALQVVFARGSVIRHYSEGVQLAGELPDDPDEHAAKLVTEFNSRASKLAVGFDEAEKRFNDLYAMVRDQKYVVKPTWQHYVGLVREGVEGRNEPPDEND
jgi:hypothetical protein